MSNSYDEIKKLLKSSREMKGNDSLMEVRETLKHRGLINEQPSSGGGYETATNPMGTWEGHMKDVTGPGTTSGWSDSHKKSLVFAFRDPIAIDAYSFTTSVPEAGIEGDPVSWKLESSQNGTFWTVRDTQTKFPTPVGRFKETNKLYFTV